MTFVWQASFWCEHCSQNIIRPVRFLNWTDEPSEEEKTEPLAYMKRLHDQQFHIYCGSCHETKGREAFKESLPDWDGREMREICDECFAKNKQFHERIGNNIEELYNVCWFLVVGWVVAICLLPNFEASNQKHLVNYEPNIIPRGTLMRGDNLRLHRTRGTRSYSLSRPSCSDERNSG